MERLNIRRRPEIRVFAGPNGSGKSTITTPDSIIPPYINADVIKKETGCSELYAAQAATKLREDAVEDRISFTFETVLSTERNLLLLQKAKSTGYFIRCSFVLTAHPDLNIARVLSRVEAGGHAVPPEKVTSRYYKALSMIPQLLCICDRLNIYDNSLESPIRIFKKRNDAMSIFENPVWSQDDILRLISGTYLNTIKAPV